MIRNFSVKSKLLAVTAVFLVGFAGFGLFAYDTIEDVKVNGPYYRSIIQGKDVIADVLPPPEYIIEAYLVVLQMTGESDKSRLAAMVDRGRKLKEEYEERHAFWVKDLPEGKLKEVLVVQSYQPAIRFFDVRDMEFIPALLKGDAATARELSELDTFDMLAPTHDHPQTARTVRRWIDEAGLTDAVVETVGGLVRARARRPA